MTKFQKLDGSVGSQNQPSQHFKLWTEMKFDEAIPDCRTMHAQMVYKERLYIYGGTDLKLKDAETDTIWHIDPLSAEKPCWTS